MPLRIDISDAAIEKHELTHRLHVWGPHTSAWKTNCILCGKDTGTNKLRCPCADGFFCSPDCYHHASIPTHQCGLIKEVPLTARPSPNHRRAVIFRSDQPQMVLAWAEIKGNELVINHETLEDYFDGCVYNDGAWLELAVINPAVPSEAFRKIGHGIAMGESPSPLDPVHI
jgi:hypothetical protein